MVLLLCGDEGDITITHVLEVEVEAVLEVGFGSHFNASWRPHHRMLLIYIGRAERVNLPRPIFIVPERRLLINQTTRLCNNRVAIVGESGVRGERSLASGLSKPLLQHTSLCFAPSHLVRMVAQDGPRLLVIWICLVHNRRIADQDRVKLAASLYHRET